MCYSETRASRRLLLCILSTVIFFLISGQANAQTPPVISSSSPPSGYVDPLEDRDATTGTLLGLKDISITFSKPVTATGGGALSLSNFTRRYFRNGVEVSDLQTQQIPTVSLVSGNGAGPYLLRFIPRIPLGAWTEITAVNVVDGSGISIPSTGNRIVVGSLPMDTTQDGKVLGDDINRWLQISNNLYNPAPLTKLNFCDQKRNGTILGEDIARAMQLVNGVGTFRVWNNYDIGSSTSAGTTCTNGLRDGSEQGVDCGGGCPFECPLSHIIGIDLTLNGTPGKDYAVEWMYHDKSDDSKVIYLKDSVKIGFAVNDHNHDGEAGIRFKIDGDENSISYYSDNNATYGAKTPLYQTPFSLSERRYADNNQPVVGAVNPNTPGKALNNNVDYNNSVGYKGARKKYNSGRINYGIKDDFGDEWHVLTFWENRDRVYDGRGDRDIDYVLLVVNPKTPAISFKPRNSTGQFYTTPAKTYWVPVLHEQSTYLTNDIDIVLTNLSGSAINYRINGGDIQTYSSPINSNDLPSGTNELEYWFDSNHKKTRTLIKNPPYPSANETHPHNFLSESPIVLNNINPAQETTNQACNLGIDYDDSRFGEAPAAQALTASQTDARKAKCLLLRQPICRLVGQERWDTAPAPYMFYYQGSGSGREGLFATIAYDLLIGNYKTSNNYKNGFTPIEDLRVRDCLADYAKLTLQLVTENSAQYMNAVPNDPGPGDIHWGASAEIATAIIALTMPKYDSIYYGTSGAPPNNLTATHAWTPYRDFPNDWWDVATNEYPTLHDNPNQSTYSRIDTYIQNKGENHVLGPAVFDGYWQINVRPMYVIFANVIHRLGYSGYNLTPIDTKMRWYINYEPCSGASESACIEFPQVNKYFSHGMEAYNRIVQKGALGMTSNITTRIGVLGNYFYDPEFPLCFNGQRDGHESGVDCGGSCANNC